MKPKLLTNVQKLFTNYDISSKANFNVLFLDFFLVKFKLNVGRETF